MAHVTDYQRIEKDEHLTGDAAIAKVRKLLPSFSAAIFVTGVGSCKDLHSRPLAIQGEPAVFGGTLWFFADDRSPKAYDANYLQLSGTGALSKEKSKNARAVHAVIEDVVP